MRRGGVSGTLYCSRTTLCWESVWPSAACGAPTPLGGGGGAGFGSPGFGLFFFFWAVPPGASKPVSPEPDGIVAGACCVAAAVRFGGPKRGRKRGSVSDG